MLLMIRCLCDIEFNNMMYINRPKKNEFIDNISAATHLLLVWLALVHYPFIFRLVGGGVIRMWVFS